MYGEPALSDGAQGDPRPTDAAALFHERFARVQSLVDPTTRHSALRNLVYGVGAALPRDNVIEIEQFRTAAEAVVAELLSGHDLGVSRELWDVFVAGALFGSSYVCEGYTVVVTAAREGEEIKLRKTQAAIVGALSAARRAMQPTELSQYLDIALTSISRAMKTLVDEGYAELCTSAGLAQAPAPARFGSGYSGTASDRRGKLYRLTAKGEAAARRLVAPPVPEPSPRLTTTVASPFRSNPGAGDRPADSRSPAPRVQRKRQDALELVGSGR